MPVLPSQVPVCRFFFRAVRNVKPSIFFLLPDLILAALLVPTILHGQVFVGPETMKILRSGISDPDVRLLEHAHINTDAVSLSAYLRKTAAQDEDLLQLDSLCRQLADKDFRQREGAAKRIVAIGTPAIQALLAACRSPDPEVVTRSLQCLESIRSTDVSPITSAAVRVLIRQEPADALSTLLKFLPSAASAEQVELLWYGIQRLHATKPAIARSLLDGLQDPLPARRALSACLIASSGDLRLRPSVCRLLADTDPHVRLRTAQGLLAARDPAGIPALIDLLDVPSIEFSWQAEELLHWAAGHKAPLTPIGIGSRAPRAC
jgi:HEAT repeat protein